MRRFENTGLWEVLASGNPSQALTTKINTVLGDFFDELYAYCREEKNIAERTRSLNYARSELTAFMENPSCGSKKKCAPSQDNKEGVGRYRLRNGYRQDGSGTSGTIYRFSRRPAAACPMEWHYDGTSRIFHPASNGRKAL